MPKSRRRGTKLSARKSTLGASGLWVPPSRRTREGASARHSAGSIVCSTSVQDPALPVANE
jgi:hypothetical protein